MFPYVKENIILKTVGTMGCLYEISETQSSFRDLDNLFPDKFYINLVSQLW